MNSSIFKTALFGVLLLLGGQANALMLTPDDADFSGIDPTNPNVSDVETITGDTGLTELYKSEVDGGNEEGPFASAYETEYFNSPTDPADADITYVGGGFMADAQWLLVKDGVAHDPIWYIFDISDWDGMETIELRDFWPEEGAISHVSIYGGTAVPAPGAAFLLGLGLIGLVGMRKKVS
jgi:hypothetical protein